MGVIKKKVLIIDDDVDILTLLKDTLEENFYECEVAPNAPEGLRKAHISKPNLILLDLMLPKMSGFGFLRELRHDPELRQTPVIVLTALSDEDIVEESLDLGAVSYLSKASMVKELLPVVREYI
jgi:DNA-binding response OmpR family regulator